MADVSDDDEVLELETAPIGSCVRLHDGQGGCVRSISPGNSRMLVCLDATGEEVWVSAEDPWTLSELTLHGTGGDAAEDASQDATCEGDEPTAAADVPIIENWHWTTDGALCGYVYGKAGYRDGELMLSLIHI